MFEQRSIDIFWNRVIKDLPNRCWAFKGAKDRDGYYRFAYKFLGEKKYKHSSAHRFMVMITQNQVIPPGKVVMHSCDNPGCVNPAHLSVGTVQDNNLDKLLKGRARAPKGERQANALVSDEVARKIKSEAVVGYRVGYNNGSNLKK